MNPIQFALQDKAVHEIFNASGSGAFIETGWILLVILILIAGGIFFKFYKKDKNNKGSK